MILPIPDGTIGVPDRYQLAGKYSGLSSLINTRNRRASLIGFDAIFNVVLPASDAAITSPDKYQLAGKYIGLAAVVVAGRKKPDRFPF